MTRKPTILKNNLSKVVINLKVYAKIQKPFVALMDLLFLGHPGYNMGILSVTMFQGKGLSPTIPIHVW